MRDGYLKKLLNDLNDELATVECADAESEARLCKLREEVERTLAESAEEPENPATLLESLAAARDRFELSHPRLTMIIERVTNALSNMGI